MPNKYSLALKASCVLWVVWGLVHAFAGFMTISLDPSSGFSAIAAGVDGDELAADYHPAVGAILNQHGWNLLWAGVTTIVGAMFIWKGNRTAIWVTALVGGLFDVGYLVFIDIGGFGTFFPGTLMTLFSGTAIIASFWVWRTAGDSLQGD